MKDRGAVAWWKEKQFSTLTRPPRLVSVAQVALKQNKGKEQ
jgi:hypothetical protein